jgi:hypothetical protein
MAQAHTSAAAGIFSRGDRCMDPSAETRSLKDYLRAIKARRRLVIATTVAGE